MTTLIPSVSPAQRYHWTVKAFYRAIDAGVFDEPNRLELIRGELVRKEPMNPPHALTTERNAALFRRLLGNRFWVREEKPFHIAFDGEPVPDIALIDLQAQRLTERHPNSSEMRLVFEISDTTIAFDTGDKALLYAQAGISDYWALLLNRRQLWVYRHPTPDGYPEPLRLSETDTIRPLCAPDVEIAVADLLPVVRREPVAENNL